MEGNTDSSNGMNSGETDEEKVEGRTPKEVLSELIMHVNTLDEKINTINDSMAEIKDMQLVNKLDIINLNSEIKRIGMNAPEITPEMAENLKRISEILENAKVATKWKEMEKDVEAIKYRLVEMESPGESRKKQEPPKEAKPEKRKEEKFKTCKQCGSVLKPGGKFCGKCGKKV